MQAHAGTVGPHVPKGTLPRRCRGQYAISHADCQGKPDAFPISPSVAARRDRCVRKIGRFEHDSTSDGPKAIKKENRLSESRVPVAVMEIITAAPNGGVNEEA